jgi:hypothetical protein
MERKTGYLEEDKNDGRCHPTLKFFSLKMYLTISKLF